MKRVIIICSIVMLSLPAIAQDSKVIIKTKPDVQVLVNRDSIPVVYIDGKRYDYDVLRIIDKEKIASVDVLKGDNAMKQYNEPAVVRITTKDAASSKEEVKIRIKSSSDTGVSKPVVILDGVVAEPGALDALDPEMILTINVRKDEDAMKEYNTETGVIFIVTKKEKKK